MVSKVQASQGAPIPRQSTDQPPSLLAYAGFWRRLLANLLDSLILLPATALAWWALSSRSASIAALVPAGVCGPLYSLCMHARWGQTLGKMAAGIRVVTITGCRISWREALLRDSVGTAFSALATASLALAVFRLPESVWHGGRETIALLFAAQPRWGHWASTAGSLWLWSELLVLLCNKQRRALHDFIAGTLVIRTARARRHVGVVAPS